MPLTRHCLIGGFSLFAGASLKGSSVVLQWHLSRILPQKKSNTGLTVLLVCSPKEILPIYMSGKE